MELSKTQYSLIDSINKWNDSKNNTQLSHYSIPIHQISLYLNKVGKLDLDNGKSVTTEDLKKHLEDLIQINTQLNIDDIECIKEAIKGYRFQPK